MANGKPPRIVKREFEPTKKDNDPVGVKRRLHLMIVGGREGVSAAQRPVRTGWDGRPSDRWTNELKENDTWEDARTQPANLRIVKPGLRAWRQGVMRVSDIEMVIGAPDPKRFKTTAGIPAELSVWVEDEDVYRIVEGRIFAVAVPKPNERRATPEPPVDSVEYAKTTGIKFAARSGSGLGADPVWLPYWLIARVRKIHNFRGTVSYVRVSATTSPGLNAPRDEELHRKISSLENYVKSVRNDQEIYKRIYGTDPEDFDVTPFTSLNVATAGRSYVLPVVVPRRGSLVRPSPYETFPSGGPERPYLDVCAAVNLFRSISAANREAQGQVKSVLIEPQDTLRAFTPWKKLKRRGV